MIIFVSKSYSLSSLKNFRNDGIFVKISKLHGQNLYQRKIQTIVANFNEKPNPSEIHEANVFPYFCSEKYRTTTSLDYKTMLALSFHYLILSEFSLN